MCTCLTVITANLCHYDSIDYCWNVLFAALSCKYVLNFFLYATIVRILGEQEIPGITDTSIARRLGPKRASGIRRLFHLSKQDDVRQYVVRRQLPAKEGQFIFSVTCLWDIVIMMSLLWLDSPTDSNLEEKFTPELPPQILLSHEELCPLK